jgi:hypothetical protein
LNLNKKQKAHDTVQNAKEKEKINFFSSKKQEILKDVFIFCPQKMIIS